MQHASAAPFAKITGDFALPAESVVVGNGSDTYKSPPTMPGSGLGAEFAGVVLWEPAHLTICAHISHARASVERETHTVFVRLNRFSVLQSRPRLGT